MKRKVLSLVLAAATVATCFSTITVMADDTVTIRYGIWDSNQEPAIREIADAFEAANPDIKIEIEVTPWKEYWTNLETSAIGGSAPDVFWMNGPHATEYARGGMMLNLDDYIGNSETVAKEDFPSSLIDLYTIDGGWYGMPKGFDTGAIWYNKTLFDAAGIEYPSDDWTWEEFWDTAVALTDAENGIYGTAVQLDEQAGWYNTIGMFGGWVISDDKKESGFADENTIAGIQCWVDMIEAGISPTYAQLSDTSSNTLFESGKIAMQFGASYNLAEYSTIEGFCDEIDVVSLPSVNGTNSCVIHGLGQAIFSQTEHAEEAWRWVEYLGGKEAMDMQAQAGIDISARTESTSLWADSYPQYNLAAFMNAAETAYQYPASANTSAWMNVMYDEVYAAFNGDKTVEEACNNIATQMNDFLAAE